MTDRLPAVYLLGDSICGGYGPLVQQALAGEAEVLVRPDNGKDSRILLTRAAEWLGERSYAVIHFNCGLHDIKLAHGVGTVHVPIDEYAANLNQLITLLRPRTRALIWARTTPVRDGQLNPNKRFDRLNRDVELYNRTADGVMKNAGVPSNDLHKVVLEAGLHTSMSADGVHFTEYGYSLLSGQVTAAIRTAIMKMAERTQD
jgi:hypothetical protein